VRAAHRDHTLSEPRQEEWLLIEWPPGEREPTKYWLSTLPADITFAPLVDLTMLRWRIERDYQELKQELGLGHFEGRGWRGFHHHASLCIAAYGFLIAERARFSPSGAAGAGPLQVPRLPAGYRPRGTPAAAGAARGGLDCDDATAAHGGAGAPPCAMSLLRTAQSEPEHPPSQLVTQ
jgi:hypothetical protein